MNENIYNLKNYADKYKSNKKQVYSYNIKSNSPNHTNNKTGRKMQLYNSKSLDKDSLRQLIQNKEKNKFIYDLDINIPLIKAKNPMKISVVKYNSPVKSGPFEKEKLT